jgi:multiple sugar transport system permease protein
MTRVERKNLRNGLLFVSPWIIGFLAFTVYPVIMSLYYSFCDYSVLEPPLWIGLENFTRLLYDDIFWISLYNTFYFAILAIPLGIFVALSLALLLNSGVRGMGIFRTVFFLPTLVPVVAMAILWQFIFNPSYGILNMALKGIFGIEGPHFLGEEAWAKPALVFMGLWTVGQGVVTYLAGLQEVPKSLYEAAELDGASYWHKVRHVTLPMISPVLYFNFIMGIIGALQVFAQVYIMTGGGPGRSTTFYTLYLYQKAFEDYQMGYASAMAWILFVLILVLTLWAQHISKKYVFYRGG